MAPEDSIMTIGVQMAMENVGKWIISQFYSQNTQHVPTTITGEPDAKKARVGSRWLNTAKLATYVRMMMQRKSLGPEKIAEEITMTDANHIHKLVNAPVKWENCTELERRVYECLRQWIDEDFEKYKELKAAGEFVPSDSMEEAFWNLWGKDSVYATAHVYQIFTYHDDLWTLYDYDLNIDLWKFENTDQFQIEHLARAVRRHQVRSNINYNDLAVITLGRDREAVNRLLYHNPQWRDIEEEDKVTCQNMFHWITTPADVRLLGLQRASTPNQLD